MLLSNSYSKLGCLMIEKILVPLKNGLAPWELDTWRNMRKVSSEAASISCIYFQQKKLVRIKRSETGSQSFNTTKNPGNKQTKKPHRTPKAS